MMIQSAVSRTDEHAPLLRLRNVSKTYRMGEVDVPVLRDINLDVFHGELLVVVGPSGSGKSTLLNLIGGIDTPTSGDIFFDGRNIARLEDAELTTYRRESVGFVFQFYNLVPSLTAVENVQVSTEISSDPLDPATALELVELHDRLQHFPSQMSGGEQQRVAIARAVAKNPKLLLCDEPTGALDLRTGRIILGAIARLHRELGKTVVIITHNSAISDLANRTVRLGSGTIAETVENARPLEAAEIVW